MLFPMPEIRIVHGENVTELYVDEDMFARLNRPDISAKDVLVAMGYEVTEEWLEIEDKDESEND